MTAVDYLEAKGVKTAAEIARGLQREVVEVYAELVTAESLGMVRVVVDYSDEESGGKRFAAWEAMAC
jgi:hypothetical protein